MKKFAINIVKFLLFGTVLWFLYSNISENYDKIRTISLTSYDPKYIFFSVIAVFVSLIYPVFVWKYLIRSMGEKINTLSALRIWFISNLGRYIPGKVFQVAGLVYLAGKEGVTKSKAVQSVLYSQITANGLGLFIGLGLISVKSDIVVIPNYLNFIFITVAVLAVVFWFPVLFLKSSNIVLKKMNRELIQQTLSRRSYMIYLLLQMINWLLMSLSFVFIVEAYTDISVFENMEILFILPLSWTLGLIAIFAPGGIGVREGAMSYWLSAFIPLHFALVLPWIYRILVTLSEIILTIIFSVSYRKPDMPINENNGEQKKS